MIFISRLIWYAAAHSIRHTYDIQLLNSVLVLLFSDFMKYYIQSDYGDAHVPGKSYLALSVFDLRQANEKQVDVTGACTVLFTGSFLQTWLFALSSLSVKPSITSNCSDILNRLTLTTNSSIGLQELQFVFSKSHHKTQISMYSRANITTDDQFYKNSIGSWCNWSTGDAYS
jgi:hypothetical protein